MLVVSIYFCIVFEYKIYEIWLKLKLKTINSIKQWYSLTLNFNNNKNNIR